MYNSRTLAIWLDVATKQVSKIVSEKSDDIPSSASDSLARQKSISLFALAEAYVKIGDGSAAEVAARAIDHPQYRASALTLVASSFAQAADLANATKLLRTALQLSGKAPDYGHDTFRERALYLVAKTAASVGLKDISSDALEQFLRTIIKDDWYDAQLSILFEMGLEVEASGIPISKESRSLLKQIVSKVTKDQ
jgi:hypothetical protein